MATKVVMEALSPTMEEGRLVKWLKNEGDAISSGDILAEVETDKAVMELVARGDGVLRKRIANEGDSSAVGTLLAVIGSADEDIASLVGGAAESAAPPAAETPAAASEAGNQPAAAPSDAAQPSAAAQPAAATATPVAPPVSAPPAPPAPPQPAPAESGDGRRPRSSPLARRLASERGIELSQLSGSGPGGRIIKKDIENAPKQAAAPAATLGKQPEADPERFISREGDYQDIPLTQIRKTIARRLSESIGPIPTF
ncbi:MAG: E3 binding domain-containing protein, partial [Gemmatimonadaceae bacterium]